MGRRRMNDVRRRKNGEGVDMSNNGEGEMKENKKRTGIGGGNC